MTRLQSTDSFCDVFTPTSQKMVEFPFRHEFELFSYSFICCKVSPFSLISACGLYFLYIYFILLYFLVCVFPCSINTMLCCVTLCLFDDSCAFSSLKKHFAVTLHNDKSYPAACSLWQQNKDILFCRFFFFFFTNEVVVQTRKKTFSYHYSLNGHPPQSHPSPPLPRSHISPPAPQ